MNKEIVITDLAKIESMVVELIGAIRSGGGKSSKFILSLVGLSDLYCAKLNEMILLVCRQQKFDDYRHVPLGAIRNLASSGKETMFLSTDRAKFTSVAESMSKTGLIIMHGSILPLSSTVPLIESVLPEHQKVFVFTRPSAVWMSKSFRKLASLHAGSAKHYVRELGSDRLPQLYNKLAKYSLVRVEDYCDKKLALMYNADYSTENVGQVQMFDDKKFETFIRLETLSK